MEKKQYKAPEIKCIEFVVELGYSASGRLTQQLDLFEENSHPFQSDPSDGYFPRDNGDWD